LVNPAAYAALDVRLGALLLIPTVRIDHFSGVDRLSGTSLVQPRLSARWSVGEFTTIKVGAGIYSKYPELPQIMPAFGNVALGPELSRQYSAGVERRLTGALRVDAVVFYKDLYRQVSQVADPAIKYDNNGRGRVYGGEVLLKHEPGVGRLSGWAAYTILRSERRESGQDRFHLYDYDQTHNLNVVAQLRLTSTVELGARFRYVTGNPLTPVVGATFDSDADIYAPTFGPTNSSRLGAFHQLDVRIDKHWVFRTWRLTAYVDVQNAYNRKNPEGKTYNYNYRQSEPLAGLPLIPSFGVKGEF
jgi:outer membrane receptor protein involved in Fe transport